MLEHPHPHKKWSQNRSLLSTVESAFLVLRLPKELLAGLWTNLLRMWLTRTWIVLYLPGYQGVGKGDLVLMLRDDRSDHVWVGLEYLEDQMLEILYHFCFRSICSDDGQVWMRTALNKYWHMTSKINERGIRVYQVLTRISGIEPEQLWKNFCTQLCCCDYPKLNIHFPANIKINTSIQKLRLFLDIWPLWMFATPRNSHGNKVD